MDKLNNSKLTAEQLAMHNTTMTQAVIKEAEELADILIPALRSYVNDLRGVRLAIHSEVRDIVRISQEVTTISKEVQQLREYAGILLLLKETMTPDFIEALHRLTNKESK